MNSISKKVETAAHVAVIIVAALLGAALIKRVFPTHAHEPAAEQQVKVGTRLLLPRVGWTKGGQTLVLVLSTSCPYCTESAPFYRQIAQENEKREDVRIVAVFSQSVDNARKYLNNLGVVADEVNQAAPDVIGVRGTPTVLLVDGKGNVQKVWVGKLSPDKEAEVLNELRREG